MNSFQIICNFLVVKSSASSDSHEPINPQLAVLDYACSFFIHKSFTFCFPWHWTDTPMILNAAPRIWYKDTGKAVHPSIMLTLMKPCYNAVLVWSFCWLNVSDGSSTMNSKQLFNGVTRRFGCCKIVSSSCCLKLQWYFNSSSHIDIWKRYILFPWKRNKFVFLESEIF